MPIVADGAVRVAADMDPFNKELKSGLGKAETQAQSFGQKLNAALSPKNLAAGLGIGFGIAQVTSFLGDAIGAASDLGETVSKTSQVLGEDALPALEEWAEGAADAFGQSKRTALDAASSFAIFGKSAGLAGDDLVGFSTDLTELSADFSSFFNTSPEEAIQAIGAALRGESEPIRRYGILLDDATLRQRAFSMGITDSIKNALTPQQRVLAAQAEIMAQSADAQGDFARTSDGLANQQRILQAKLENVTAEIGERLLPVMVDFVTFINDKGIPVLRDFLKLLDVENSQSAEGIPILQEIEDFLNFLSDAPTNTMLEDMLHFDPKIEAAARQLGITYQDMAAKIEDNITRTGRTQHDVIEGMTRDFDALPETISASVLASTAAWKQNDLGQAASEAAQAIPDAFSEAQEEAEAIVRQTPGALANQLRAGIDDYDKAIDELTEVAVNSVSDLAERQKIEGILASQELTDALNSDSTRTRLLAADLVTDLVNDYELLAPGALGAGQLVNPNLSAGIRGNLGLTRAASSAVRDAAGNSLVDLGPQAFGWGSMLSANFLAGMRSYIGSIRATSIELGDAAAYGIRFRSPAKGGPLSDRGVMGGWGEQLGEWFASGMRSSVPGIQGASLAMAGAAVLQGSVGGMGTMGAIEGGAMGGSGPTFILQVEGENKVVGSRDDVLNAWQQMTSFSKEGVQ